MPWLSVIFYCLFGMFVYNQQAAFFYRERTIPDGGPPKTYGRVLLLIFSLGGIVAGVVYLIYSAFCHSWWMPFAIFGIQLLSTPITSAIEKAFGYKTLGIVAFVAVPILGYLMFKYVSD